MRVKLVFEKNTSGQTGLDRNTFSEEIEVKLPESMESAHLVSAVCYGTKDTNAPINDCIAVIAEWEDDNRLVGRLLTYVDATFTDIEQRKAHKDIVKDIVYGHQNQLRERARHIIESQN